MQGACGHQAVHVVHELRLVTSRHRRGCVVGAVGVFQINCAARLDAFHPTHRRVLAGICQALARGQRHGEQH